MLEEIGERRKHRRVLNHLPVCMRVERSGRYVETLAKDLSVGGLRCVVDGHPDINEAVIVEFPLAKEVTPIRTQARVAWTQPIIPQSQWLVGLSFEGLSPAHQQVLAHYLEHLPSTQQPTQPSVSK